MHPSKDPRRHRLKLDDWPESDRAAWAEALAPGDLLDGTMGPAHHWGEETRDLRRKAYGRWLSSRIAAGGLDPAAVPTSRITRDSVSAYISELQAQVAPWTVLGYIAGLHAIAVTFNPEGDWQWLRRVVAKLEVSVRDSKDKHSRLRPAPEILDWAISRLQKIEREPPKRFADTHYRDALMIGLLICCPTMRLRNLTGIEIGRHLIPRSDGWELRFPGAEMKARKPVEMRVPEILNQYLARYLDCHRPALLDGAASERLWITQYGKPMTQKMVSSRIIIVTKRAFGMPINPHLFRDCAVTFVALNDPKHVGIAAPLLGHIDPRTTERHYIQAQQIAAGTKLQSSLQTLRKQHAPLQYRPTDQEDPDT
ncbi:site-specific integrase [Roseovarius sp. EGI FJ00037]|uniref:site-specific integrase n=1 Tax=Roseovarius salincola TaxID=2978479 RepID=UPI0022A892C7|nr:site-specific integrase [Roseovarius sp. EGI FJ00037]MCZ0813533.1 site-specific integrase [Roseovarius sp. EGI FJ00037]